ncbi:MAG: hypothetical protein AAF195_02015 [Pseudomonadota bacterium]
MPLNKSSENLMTILDEQLQFQDYQIAVQEWCLKPNHNNYKNSIKNHKKLMEIYSKFSQEA